jgi:hypothetical protein
LYDAALAAGHSAHALRTQYRLPPAVASVLSHHVYDGAVTSAPGHARAAEAPGVVWHDVPDGAPAQRFGSYYNVAEVHAAVAVMDAIDAAHAADGGARVVLTPYREQRDALEAAAGCRARAHGGCWDVKTVDAMQGREARHVVLSLVRVPTAGGGGAGFLRDARRANVALSRCAGQLAVVGHHGAWAAEAHPAALLRALARQTPPTLAPAAAPGAAGMNTRCPGTTQAVPLATPPGRTHSAGPQNDTASAGTPRGGAGGAAAQGGSGGASAAEGVDDVTA